MDITRTIKTTSVIFLLFIFQISFGQSADSDTTKSIQIRLICSPTISSTNPPFYIITADNQRFQIPEDGNLKDSTAIANTISYIDPNWIKSINVLKDKDATDQYGIIGQNGVIVIDLKKGSLEKFPSKFRKKFKEYVKN
jgi:outer membrane receptor protein involved in Fe transport